jgi:hypothetical protein
MDFFGSTTKRLDICAVTVEPSQPEPIEGLSNAYLEVKKRGGTLRLLTEITPQNSGYLKEVERKGTDIRHLSGIGGNFAISDTEYVATLGTEEFDPRGALLRSNDQLFVTHHKRLFDLLWAGAMPAEQRFAEIERGLTPPKMEVLYDPVKIQKKYMDLIGQARSDVMLMLPTVSSFHRQESIGAIDSLSAMAKKGDVRVRVISPVDSEIEKRIVAEQSLPSSSTGSRPGSVSL